jgi:uncharacterized protein YjbI with pentapeptide repeats
MANDEHVAMLKKGVEAWNAWRDENPDIDPDLFEADLNGTNLRGANLSRANLRGANLRGANLSGRTHMERNLKAGNLSRVGLSETDLMDADLSGADLSGADLGGADLRFTNLSRAGLSETNLMEADVCGVDLSGADLTRANLREADFKGAKLIGADLTEAILYKADLSGADLSGGADLGGANLMDASLAWANLSRANIIAADLSAATLVETDLTGADLTGCRIYGVSAWGLKLERTKQQNLVVTSYGEPEITVDSIEVAQFVYLLLHNEKIRDVIDTVGKKAVLLLGRFTDERKAVLDALREELRKRDYLPILFDFDVPATRDITETVSLLARMARFIIADLTDPSSIPKELEAIVPQLAVPVQPLLEGASRPYAMFKDYWKYEWVLPVYRYEGLEPLLATLAEKVIAPAEAKVKALEERRRMIEAELTKPQ